MPGCKRPLVAAACALAALLLGGCGTASETDGHGGRVGATCSAMGGHGRKMECGAGVALCGVLTVEMGTGPGAYHHKEPVVHGLWPQVAPYGDSRCVAPQDRSPPSSLASCYQQPDGEKGQLLSFERHEWGKHGTCAGVKDAGDFFGQICGLSKEPLRVMAGARAADLDVASTADQLQRSGFCVWSLGSSQQIELSACAGADGRWKLADVGDFPKVCGGGGPGPSPSPSPTPPPPTPSPSGGACVPGRHGPACHENSDCAGHEGCLRCAKSGFCTDQPLQPLQPGRFLDEPAQRNVMHAIE